MSKRRENEQLLWEVEDLGEGLLCSKILIPIGCLLKRNPSKPWNYFRGSLELGLCFSRLLYYAEIRGVGSI